MNIKILKLSSICNPMSFMCKLAVFSLLAASFMAVGTINPATVVYADDNRDWNRTENECRRLEDPRDEEACLEWARENPGGVSREDRQWNRTENECRRLEDPRDEEACLEWARENPGGVSRENEGSSTESLNFEGDCNDDVLTPENCGIIAYIRLFTDALLTIVGIVVVMTIVIGGIQYSAARDNPQAVAAAKKRISQALIALVIYLFMFAFLQWLVPGGVF